jgi:hypothetical protein
VEVTIVGNGVTAYVCNGREEVVDVIVALARGEEDAAPQDTDSEAAAE